ncbi:MAG: class IV adenylate cyclase [Bacteroidetes bacterium]|nr:class IV adenylate cyclase [Bacteroidota bacterium]
MNIINVEIKALCKNPERMEKNLYKENAVFKGTDHQTDTYFNVKNGRLKLREGNIENALIFYHRPNQSGPKKSEVALFPVIPGSTLKEIMENSLGIKIIVNKTRKIFYIDNVKIHLDRIYGLGSFIEIEASGKTGVADPAILMQQCRKYQKKFGIKKSDLVSKSYCDLLEENKGIT